VPVGRLRLIRELFTGTTRAADGPAFDDFLSALGHADVAERMHATLDEAIAAANALPDSLITALTTDYDKVVATHRAVTAFTTDLKSQFLTAGRVLRPAGDAALAHRRDQGAVGDPVRAEHRGRRDRPDPRADSARTRGLRRPGDRKRSLRESASARGGAPRALAVMAEYVKLRTDGFKDLDGGGRTGFDKDDLQVTARASSSPSAEHYHQLELRLGYGTETSHETYTGLADADFAVAPQRRYVASQLDEMNWHHWRMRATHRLELAAHTRTDTVLYRQRFHRAWGKVDGFVGQRDFYALLAEPTAGATRCTTRS
jgi:hypothetical protein